MFEWSGGEENERIGVGGGVGSLIGRLAKEQHIKTGVETKGWGVNLSKVLEDKEMQSRW